KKEFLYLMSTNTTTLWKVDPPHSDIQFKVKHVVVSTVTRGFHTFHTTTESEVSDYKVAATTFEADIDSISAGDDGRGEYRKSGDLFDDENNLKLKHKSNFFNKLCDLELEVTGDFTIAGKMNEITLDVDHGGIATGAQGHTRAGFYI